MACPRRHHCEHYHAVGLATNDPRNRLTCRVGDRFPLFVAVQEARIVAAA